MGERIRSENGVGAAVQLIHRHIQCSNMSKQPTPALPVKSEPEKQDRNSLFISNPTLQPDQSSKARSNLEQHGYLSDTTLDAHPTPVNINKERKGHKSTRSTDFGLLSSRNRLVQPTSTSSSWLRKKTSLSFSSFPFISTTPAHPASAQNSIETVPSLTVSRETSTVDVNKSTENSNAKDSEEQHHGQEDGGKQEDIRGRRGFQRHRYNRSDSFAFLTSRRIRPEGINERSSPSPQRRSLFRFWQ